jgi:predicted nucleic-acid-binding Zn-ribbon protein
MERFDAASLASQLKKKGVTLPCPRCGHKHFSIVGQTSLAVATGGGLLGMFGQDVPAVVVGCGNCGYLTLHSSAVLQKPSGMRGAFDE